MAVVSRTAPEELQMNLRRDALFAAIKSFGEGESVRRKSEEDILRRARKFKEWIEYGTSRA